MMYKSVAGLLAVHNVLGGGDRPAIIVDLTTNFSIPKTQKKKQGCISCGILVSGIRARGVSSEHMENMEMFSNLGAL